MFAFGRTADNAGYLTATPGAGTTRHQASIAGPGASPVAQTVTGPAALAANTFKHVAVTIKGGDALTPGQMLLYEDGALVASNTALTLKPSDIASATSFIGRSANASGQQFRGTHQGLPHLLEGADGEPGAGAVERAGAGQPRGAEGLGRSRRHQRGDPGTSRCRRAAGRDVEHQRPGGGHGAGRGHPPGRRPGRRARDADGHVHPPRPDGHQVVPDHGQAAGGDPRRTQLAAGLVHYYKLDETAGTTLADSGTAGAAGNATLVNPAKATLTGAGVTLNPDAYADSLTGAYVDLPDNITAGMTELSVDYDIRIDPANVGDHQLWSFGRKTTCDGDGQRRLRAARSSARTPCACAPA